MAELFCSRVTFDAVAISFDDDQLETDEEIRQSEIREGEVIGID